MVVGVYGLGRFGAYWAGLLARDFDVIGYSRNPSRSSPAGVRRVDEARLLADSDVLFLCVAISAMGPVLERIGSRIKPGTLVADTCSVKVYPIGEMVRLLDSGVSILATHPMFGPDSGKDGVAGLPLVYHPVRMTDQQVSFWRETFYSWGLRVLDLTPDEHDREAAYTQGITHFIGRVLNDLSLSPSEIATKGYAKLLEIIEQTCNDPIQLFVDLQKYNPYTGEMRSSLAASIRRYMDMLSDSIDSKKP